MGIMVRRRNMNAVRVQIHIPSLIRQFESVKVTRLIGLPE